MDKEVQIFLKGHADPNPGDGGWAAMLVYGEHTKLISGCAPYSSVSNNAMELRAAIEGLNALTKPCRVMVYTNSKYVASLSLGNTNVALWEALLEAQAKHPLVIFEHIPKANNNDFMRQVDERAWDEAMEARAIRELGELT